MWTSGVKLSPTRAEETRQCWSHPCLLEDHFMKPRAIPYFNKDFNLPPLPLKLHPPCFIFKSQRSQSLTKLAASKQLGV